MDDDIEFLTGREARKQTLMAQQAAKAQEVVDAVPSVLYLKREPGAVEKIGHIAQRADQSLTDIAKSPVGRGAAGMLKGGFGILQGMAENVEHNRRVDARAEAMKAAGRHPMAPSDQTQEHIKRIASKDMQPPAVSNLMRQMTNEELQRKNKKFWKY